MADRIHQEMLIEASPASIYAVLTDAVRFSRMSGGASAEIDATPGGAFSCFGGMIHGRIIECSPSESLVQAWRAKTWAPGEYSVVRFRLAPEGSGTRVVLDHTGFPEDQGEHLDKGWHAHYWEPLRKFLTS